MPFAVDVAATIALFIVLAVVVWLMGDRGWYEGDAVTIVGCAMYLPAAKDGLLPLYHYSQQPLAYELLHGAFRLLDSVIWLYRLPELAGAAALAVLAFAVRLRFRAPWWICIALLFFSPELLYTALYPNTTALGALVFAIAIAAAGAKPRRSGWWGTLQAVAVGSFAAVSCGFRLDFLLAVPCLFILYWVWSEDRMRCALSWASFTVIAIGFLVQGFIDPGEIQRLFSHKGYYLHTFRWDHHDSLRVLLTVLPLPGWLMLAGTGILLVRQTLRNRDTAGVLLALAGMLTLYPITALFTPKYVLPALLLVPLLLARGRIAIESGAGTRNRRWLDAGIAATVIVCHVVAWGPGNWVPSTQAEFVHTHDGPRTYGAYLTGYARVREAEGKGPRYTHFHAVKRLAPALARSNQSVTLIWQATPIQRYFLTYYIASLGEHGFRLDYLADDLAVFRGERNAIRMKYGGRDEYRRASRRRGCGSPARIAVPPMLDSSLRSDVQGDMFYRSIRRAVDASFRSLPTRADITVSALDVGFRADGWVLSPHKIDSVRLMSGQHRKATVRELTERMDLFRRFPEYEMTRAGFSLVSRGELGSDVTVEFVSCDAVVHQMILNRGDTRATTPASESE